MKKLLLLTAVVLFTTNFSFSQYNMEEGYIETISDNNAKASFTYKHLRIYPLMAGNKFKEAHKDIGKYTTLKESLEQKKIKITETESNNTSSINEDIVNNSNENQVNTNQNNIQVQQNVSGGGGAQVNTLYVQNISKDTIYIMAGEVVKGGKQDRVLAQDMILPPNGKKVDISVFCVERNRWSYGESGKFDKYFSVSSNSIRQKVIQDQDQSAVWEEVGKTVKKNKTETNTGTYTSLVNSKEYNKDLSEYINFFMKSLKTKSNCIGFVGVSGDKIIGCDIFATPDLFNKQSETILNGYITEAIIHGSTVNIKYNDVKNYLEEILTVQQDKQDNAINEKGGQYEYKNRKIHITTF
ncbi:MAG: hypothetical protein K8R54_11195 [Bacteroidales bacterium]|nr:hypothetical protein [Bacteroidales bacterium]